VSASLEARRGYRPQAGLCAADDVDGGRGVPRREAGAVSAEPALAIPAALVDGAAWLAALEERRT
jgi:hypothetical protein